MPDLQAFHAEIKVDDIELPEYDVQVDQDRKIVSCWVPSEAGKAFSVCWSNAQPLTDTRGIVELDGIYSGSDISYKGDKREHIRSYSRISPTTARNFSFSPIALTDDDTFLDTPSANLGEIKMKFYTVTSIIRSKTPSKWVDPAATSNTKVHERSKKAGAHRIQFGGPKKIPRRNRIKSERGEKLATFVFRYRPIEILRANGIAPLAIEAANVQLNTSNKKKSSQIDVLEIESSDEDEIDRHVKELKGKLQRLESRRRAKKLKVELDEQKHLPHLNEVIDLT